MCSIDVMWITKEMFILLFNLIHVTAYFVL